MGAMNRRGFLMAGSAALLHAETPRTAGAVRRLQGTHLKIGLNAYSFNRPLMAGKMTLSDVIDYCAKHNIDGLDATGYYFPGYPNVPSDKYIRDLKRKAFVNGVTISGGPCFFGQGSPEGLHIRSGSGMDDSSVSGVR
jgi:hypothetical protein